MSSCHCVVSRDHSGSQPRDDHVDESRNANLEGLGYAGRVRTKLGDRYGVYQRHMALKLQVVWTRRMKNDLLLMRLQLRPQKAVA